MSPIGRIFMFLNLVLAAAFLGWAANALGTSEEWKQKYDEKVAEMDTALEEKQAEIDELTQESNNAQQAASQHLRERDDAQSELDRIQTNLAELKRANESLRGDLTEIRSTLGDFNDNNEQLASAKDRAIERAHEMERERDEAQQAAQEAEFAKRDAEDRAEEAESRIASLEGTVSQKESRIAQLDNTLQTIATKYNINLNEVEATPDIDAAVLQVRLDLKPGLVMLNVGKAEGVKRGMTFDIHNAGQYKGRVKVVKVQANVSSATLERPVAGQEIRQGDRATTRL